MLLNFCPPKGTLTMTTMKENTEPKPALLVYHTPNVVVFGDVRELTQKRKGSTDNPLGKGPNNMSA